MSFTFLQGENLLENNSCAIPILEQYHQRKLHNQLYDNRNRNYSREQAISLENDKIRCSISEN